MRAQPYELGPVDKPDPDTTASEQDKAQEAACGLVVSGGDAALFLEMANEAFDACTLRIERSTDQILHFAISLGRDLGRGATITQILAYGVAVIAFVGEHCAGITVALFHQFVIGGDVMRLAFTQHRADSEAISVAAEMDLGGEAAPRAPERGILKPPFRRLHSDAPGPW